MEHLKRYDFYFSYADADKIMIQEIYKQVTDYGYRCYLYSDSNSGMSFFESALNGIRQAKVLVLFITDKFMESQYCFKEAYMALENARNYDKVVIPIIAKTALKELKESTFYKEQLSIYKAISIDFTKNDINDLSKSLIQRYRNILNKDQLYEKLQEYIQLDYDEGIVETIRSLYTDIRKSLTKLKLEKDDKDMNSYLELIDLLDTTYRHVNLAYDRESRPLANIIMEMTSNARLLLDYDNGYENVKNPDLLKVSIAITLVSQIFDVQADMIDTMTGGDIHISIRANEEKIRDNLMGYYESLIRNSEPVNYKTNEFAIIKGVPKLSILGWITHKKEDKNTDAIMPNKMLGDEGDINGSIENDISNQLFAIAKYINESNKIFEKISNEDITYEFLTCLKTSYERLKNYSELVGCKDVCAYCIDKLAIINQKLGNLSEDNNNDGLKEGAIKALLGLKQHEPGEYDVFICHKKEDEDLCDSIYTFFKRNLISAFFDKITLPQLGKSEYHDAIMNSLDKSDNFIVVLSDLNYLDSHWVDLEMKTFNTELTEGRKNGNFIFIVTDEVYERIIGDNKRCLPIQYRGYEIMRIRDYKEKILEYIKK